MEVTIYRDELLYALKGRLAAVRNVANRTENFEVYVKAVEEVSKVTQMVETLEKLGEHWNILLVKDE